jgi:hypothetical protein
MTQDGKGQPLGAGPVCGRQARQWPLLIGHDLRHELPLAQNGAQQTNRCRPCRQTLCRHLATLVPLPEGRISTRRHKEPLP